MALYYDIIGAVIEGPLEINAEIVPSFLNIRAVHKDLTSTSQYSKTLLIKRRLIILYFSQLVCTTI